MHSYQEISSWDATSSISCLKEEESDAYKEYKEHQQQQSRTNSSSVRFSQELITICDSLFVDGPSPTSSSDDRESSFATRTTSASASVISSKIDKVLHLQVLQDERRRQKVEALRDAILDEQIELWASSTSDAPSICLASTTISSATAAAAAAATTIAATDEKQHDRTSSTTKTNHKNLHEKKLALLSWKHSLKDVSDALVFASELEDFLSWSSSS